MKYAGVSNLLIWRDRFLFTSHKFDAELSQRPSVALLVGAHGPISVQAASVELRCRACLVGSDVARTLAAGENGIFSLNLDPTHRLCRRLHELTGESGVADVSDRFHGAMFPLIERAVYSPFDCNTGYEYSQRVLDAAFPELAGGLPIDPRIDLVSSWLWTHVPVRVDLAYLADLCGLSQSRLAHLFTRQTGVSLRRYLLWTKMRKAAEMFVLNCSLAEIAHATGFSDAAHFSRTFARYFALNPSYLANKKLVRIQVCEAR